MKELLSSKKCLDPYRGNAETMKKLNETKQYTLMATGLLESIVTDSRLTAAAAKLWEYLYTKAIMNENLSVKIRYKDLAAKFNRSERTIKRHVESLKENDYLQVESNFNWHGQRANTYYLKIPQIIIENLNNTKDRKKLSKDDSISNKSIASETGCITSTLSIVQDNVVDTSNALTKSQNPIRKDEGCSDDKIVTPEHDINVTLNNNIKKDIILNNNNVVVSTLRVLKKATSQERTNEPAQIQPIKQEENSVLRGTIENSQDAQDQQEINKIESDINLLYVKMGNTIGAERMAIFDRIRQLQATVSTITVIMNRRSQSAQPINSNVNKTDGTTLRVDPALDFSKITGDRELSMSEIARIKNAVEKSPVHRDNHPRICNEIMYAIRFGALRITQNGDVLSIAHAISIALKLVREKRWETPAPMQRKEKMNSFFMKREDRIFQKKEFCGHQHIGALLQKSRQVYA